MTIQVGMSIREARIPITQYKPTTSIQQDRGLGSIMVPTYQDKHRDRLTTHADIAATEIHGGRSLCRSYCLLSPSWVVGLHTKGSLSPSILATNPNPTQA